MMTTSLELLPDNTTMKLIEMHSSAEEICKDKQVQSKNEQKPLKTCP